MTSDSIRQLYDFSDRTVVLTGGTGVLGSEMARSLAGCNANVVLLARNVARAQQLLETLGGTTGRHLAIGRLMWSSAPRLSSHDLSCHSCAPLAAT